MAAVEERPFMAAFLNVGNGLERRLSNRGWHGFSRAADYAFDKTRRRSGRRTPARPLSRISILVWTKKNAIHGEDIGRAALQRTRPATISEELSFSSKSLRPFTPFRRLFLLK
jgi:hypothetical protein